MKTNFTVQLHKKLNMEIFSQNIYKIKISHVMVYTVLSNRFSTLMHVNTNTIFLWSNIPTQCHPQNTSTKQRKTCVTKKVLDFSQLE